MIAPKAHIIKYRVPFSITLVIVLGFLAYMPSLDGEFIWDDHHLIEENLMIRSLANIPQLFTSGMGAGSGMQYSFYRPVTMLSHAVEYQLWKLNTTGYHITNLLLHITCAVFVLGIAFRFCNSWSASLCTAAMFLLHPVHTQTVSYISNRGELLSLLFMLGAFTSYINFLERKRNGWLVGAVVFSVLAILSKANSSSFLLLILGYHFAIKKAIPMRAFLGLATVPACYFGARFLASGIYLFENSSNPSVLQRLLGFFAAFATYIKIIILPVNLRMEYLFRHFSLGQPSVITGVALILLYVALLHTIYQKSKMVFFFLAWYGLALLPASNLYPINAYMMEHWLYTPSVGLFLLGSLLLKKVTNNPTKRAAAIVIVALLSSFYLFKARDQNMYWVNEISFYERTLQFAPNSSRACGSLGYSHFKKGNIGKAFKLYHRTIALDSGNATAYNNLGYLHDVGSKPNKKEAVKLYHKAIKADSNFAMAYNNLGCVFFEKGELDSALYFFKKAVNVNPFFAKVYANIGIAYQLKGDNQESIRYYMKGRKLGFIDKNLERLMAKQGEKE